MHALELPPKSWNLRRFFFLGKAVKHDTTVVRTRAQLIHAYISNVLALAADTAHHQCPIISAGFLHMVLAFLTPFPVYMKLSNVKSMSKPRQRHQIPNSTSSLSLRQRRQLSVLDTIEEVDVCA
jgi:hypothetical protein